MKKSHVIIMFVAVFFSFFLLNNYLTQKTISYNTTNKEYATMLSTACHDAAKVLNIEYLDDGCIFTKEKQKECLDTFYGSLVRSMNMDDTPMEYSIVEKTPFVIMVDNDGFYISYNACFDEYGNAVMPAGVDELNAVSNLNTWSESYDGNIVRFYLSDYVEVTLNNGTVLTGKPKEVCIKSGTAALNFLASAEEFEKTKRDVIIGKMEELINYVLNTQKLNVDGYATGYQVTLPQITGEDWSRMLKNPTVISFMQGKQKRMNTRMLNIYAYGAGELTESNLFYIKNDLYYEARKDEVTVNTVTQNKNGLLTAITKYYNNGEEIPNYYNSMEDCAKEGANPDVSAFSQNE